MSTQCQYGGCTGDALPIFVLAAALRWGTSLATGLWLIFVFRRYEATVALPIEYGVCTALDVISGLVFYVEYEQMSSAQLGLVVGGTASCLVGVAIGLVDDCRKSGPVGPVDANI